jgi:glucose uptake protein
MTPGVSIGFVIGGAVVLAGAIACSVLAWKTMAATKLKAQIEANPGRVRKPKSSFKAVMLCLTGGVMLGSFTPLMQTGSSGENGLGPYSMGFIFSLGVVFSTFVFNLFFMNLPVQGKVIEIGEYFRGQLQRHGLGVAAGIVWYIGLIAILIRARLEGSAHVGAIVSYPLEQGAMVVAALCGLFLWKEYEGADSATRVRLGLMFLLLAAGIGVMSAGVAAVH